MSGKTETTTPAEKIADHHWSALCRAFDTNDGKISYDKFLEAMESSYLQGVQDGVMEIGNVR